ncbi:hypothetical protein HanLR1_Chr00c2294g0839701 [Helianthus annuus]|nr:hypothetical protein HanLR1_Chr07g0255091 [Helianthus annuus]KAJ0799058.1 hypothetical protein HanLR1_Chr00c2294g0839701 [Helianthus annuus]
MDVDELRRFYDVSDGDFSRFLSSVKKTILWRQKYHLYSPQELEAWVNMVFWHGSDVMQRPCLIIRVRLAAALTSNGQAQFVRAVGMHFFLFNFFTFCYILFGTVELEGKMLNGKITKMDL